MAESFENEIYKLSPKERVSAIKQAAAEAARLHGMPKSNSLFKLNNRDVYVSEVDDRLYARATQHGRFERFSPKTGKHEGEFRLSSRHRRFY